ncbi:MAG: alpha/beta fold hydrolase [Pseudomonadota bacterium]
MRPLIFLFVAACAMKSGGEKDASSLSSSSRFERLEEGEDFPISGAQGFDTRFGYLTASENRGDPRSREIRLPVAIVKAKNARKGAAPVLYLAGGPGLSGLNAAAYPGAYPWTDDRDFIVMSQRGTAGAEPVLDCPGIGDALVEARSGDQALAVETARACRQRLVDVGVDLSAYHSAASAADIEDLRKALGVDQLSLYAVSYGTRLALTFARDFPDSVASMVLDAPLPHTARYDDQSVDNFEAALRRVAAACDSQSACHDTYPELEARFFNAIEEAKTSPWFIVDEKGSETRIEARDLARLPRLDRRADVAAAPYWMDAVARRDEAAIVRRLEGAARRRPCRRR